MKTQCPSIFIQYLDPMDQAYYESMRKMFASHKNSNKIHMKESLKQELNLILNFVMKNDGKEFMRGLACGVYSIYGGVIVNTRKLGYLLNKCKSSVNASLSQLGCDPCPLPRDTSIQDSIPYFKGNPFESRQWTFRSAPKSVDFSSMTSTLIPLSQKDQCHRKHILPDIIVDQKQIENINSKAPFFEYSELNDLSEISNEPLSFHQDYSFLSDLENPSWTSLF